MLWKLLEFFSRRGDLVAKLVAKGTVSKKSYIKQMIRVCYGRTTGIRRTSTGSRTERGGSVHGYAGARFGADSGREVRDGRNVRDVRVRAGSPPDGSVARGRMTVGRGGG